MNGFVYKWTNKINEMYYIGSRKGETNDGYIGSGLVFKRVVKKIGIQNFEREILYVGEEYRKEEDKILKQYNAAKDKMSYNLKNEALGGTFFGKDNGMFNKHHSDKSKKLISKHSNMKTIEGRLKHSKIMSGDGNPMFGKHHTKFTIDKIKNTQLRKKQNWEFLSSSKHHRTVFYKLYCNLKKYGKIISPRGQKTLEIENFNIDFPPYVRFCNFESRNLKLSYIKREMLWYLIGDKFDTSICDYASMWKDFVNKDGIINSNYGQYIFSNNDFYNTAELLTKDKDSRRASIMILNHNHLNEENVKDVPCTFGISFRIRENKLNMTVKMRSQDSYFGLASDIPIFSFIHEMMFVYLKDFYKDLEYGNYHHFVESFHIYERHFKFLNDLFKSSRYSLVMCPKISCKEEVRFLINHNFNNIPDGYEFSKWLCN